MTQEPPMALIEYLRKIGLDEDADFLREAVRVMTQALMELEVSQQIGANRYERHEERKTYRNRYRDRIWETRVGAVPLRIPKLREGSFFPSLLEPRKRSEKALLAVIQHAYIEGVSTRKVDDLVQALGVRADKSKVSRICKQLDEVVKGFPERPLVSDYPYIWLDALYLKVRHNHRVVSQALVIAMGVRSTGERDILGFELGASEEEAFGVSFLRRLIQRGLSGVQLVISDAHTGLKAAIQRVFNGVSWQRCRGHFMRNILAHIPKMDKALVAALIRTIFAQPDRQAAGAQLQQVAQAMAERWPQAAQLLVDAEADILAYMASPQPHWTRIYSTNPLERLNKEVKRRSKVVEVFPDGPATIRLVGAVLLEIDDQWQAATRRYFSLDTMRKLYDPEPELLLEGRPPTLAPVH
jgi:putative transposase